MFGMPGGWEWIVILVVALLIFGKNLPEVARAIGKALTELRKGMDDIKSDVETAVYESERDQKQIEPPKTDLPDPESEEPYEPDDTEMFGDDVDNEGFTDITDEDRAAEVEAEQEQEEGQEDTETPTEEEPEEPQDQPAEQTPPESSQPEPRDEHVSPPQPDHEEKKAS